MPKYDVSTGFRGYSREAALKLGIYSKHTYVHTTLLSAQDWNMGVIEVPIKARQVTRESRLINSIPSHLWKAGVNIIRNIALFRPLRFFGVTSVILFAGGGSLLLRFLYFYLTDGGDGHVQSVIISGVLLILSFSCLMLGLLGSSVGWSRKITEEALYYAKKRELDSIDHHGNN
jgi:hypothetical protein